MSEQCNPPIPYDRYTRAERRLLKWWGLRRYVAAATDVRRHAHHEEKPRFRRSVWDYFWGEDPVTGAEGEVAGYVLYRELSRDARRLARVRAREERLEYVRDEASERLSDFVGDAGSLLGRVLRVACIVALLTVLLPIGVILLCMGGGGAVATGYQSYASTHGGMTPEEEYANWKRMNNDHWGFLWPVV